MHDQGGLGKVRLGPDIHIKDLGLLKGTNG
jgi:hypothetical protein